MEVTLYRITNKIIVLTCTLLSVISAVAAADGDTPAVSPVISLRNALGEVSTCAVSGRYSGVRFPGRAVRFLSAASAPSEGAEATVSRGGGRRRVSTSG